MQSRIELLVTNGLGFRESREESATIYSAKKVSEKYLDIRQIKLTPRYETIMSNKNILNAQLAEMQRKMYSNYIENQFLTIEELPNAAIRNKEQIKSSIKSMSVLEDQYEKKRDIF